MSRRRLALAVLAAGAVLPSTAAAQQARAPFDVRPFAAVPDPPGLPEGIAVDPDGTVYVTTNPGGQNPGPQSGQPSQVLAYGADGTLRRRFPITGQDLTSAALPAYGLQAVVQDAAGVLYVADKVPGRIIRLDPRTGKQSDYVRFPDLPPCGRSNAVACSATAEDLRPQPDYIQFTTDGTMYVTDFQQATIWRVPPGGGRAEVAFTDFRLDGGMGPNGMQITPDGRSLFFVQSVNPPGTGTPGAGRLYRLRIADDGSLSGLSLVYETLPAMVPDGFAIGASGRFYLNQVQDVIVVNPDGTEQRRIPDDQLTNQTQAVPFDNPASSAFAGPGRLLVTNQALITRIPQHFAVLDVNVGENGMPLIRPTVPATPVAEGSGTPTSGSGADAAPTTPTSRRRPRLRASVSPHDVGPSPRRLTTTGRLALPTGVARSVGCVGRVSVQVLAGPYTVSTRRVRLRRDCTFTSHVELRFPRRLAGRRTLSVAARYIGGRELLPTRAPTLRVRLHR